MLYKKIIILFFFLLTSCSDEVSNRNSQSLDTSFPVAGKYVEGVSYKIVANEKTIKDEKSPLGEWVLSVSYPEIEGEIKNDIKSKINNSIVTLSKKHRCSVKGEHTFTSNVKFINSAVFSVNYEAMWYCPPMASPDSTTGALTFNLNTGDQINLELHFIDDEARNAFRTLIIKTLKNKVQSGDTCQKKDKYDYFYKVKDGLVFVFDVENHVDLGCITDIKISNNKLSKYLKSDSFLLK